MDTIGPQILLQVVLIALNAFFAATEIAVISLNPGKLRKMMEEGDKKAGRMLKMVEEPSGFLSTIQIGITLAGFLGSAFAAENFSDPLVQWITQDLGFTAISTSTLNTLSVVLITIILSYFTLIFGELVPKRIAMKHKEKLAEMVCGIISGLAVLLRPIIWLLSVSTNGVLRLFGIDPHEKEEPVSEEDIVLMLDAGADEGTLKQNDIEYIKNVFKLDGMTAEDVMTPRRALVLLSVNASEEEIMKNIEEEGYSRIPVYADTTDNIVGILHTRDYLLKHNRPDFTLEQAMFPPTFVPEAAHLDALLKDMQREHNHIVVVVNEYGETAGIVTIEDILEELVGEIWDERDEAIEDFTQIGDHAFRVLCSANIEDFFTFFDLSPDEETEATTVNGWLTEQIGDIPEQGYSFRYENLDITITKADDLMAQEIEVQVRDPQNEEEQDKEESD